MKNEIDNKIRYRQRNEAEYHDKKTLEGDSNQCRRHSPYYRYFEDMIGDIGGLNILDLGCGNGWFGMQLVKKGGHVWGVDISQALLKQALTLIGREGLERDFHVVRMAAEELSFDSEFFDKVIGSAILHHTNIELTIQGIQRVLKTGGQAIFIEPMNENIILRIWRRITPWRRSPLERALKLDDLETLAKYFPKMECVYFCLTSIVTEGLMILRPQSTIMARLDSLLGKVDAFLLRKFPFLGRYCAVVILRFQK